MTDLFVHHDILTCVRKFLPLPMPISILTILFSQELADTDRAKRPQAAALGFH